jgi:plastocyanin
MIGTEARWSRELPAVVAAAAIAMILAACGSTGASEGVPATVPGSSAAVSASGATLTITNFVFSPLTVTPGETVTVVNADGVEHSVTAADINLDVKVPANGTATFTAPEAPGMYRLTCDFHPSMSGSLIVRV